MSNFAVDQAIRRAMPFSAIVDINGVHNPRTGGFHVIDDAINAGHKGIFVRDGTHPPVGQSIIGMTDITLYGESWLAIIDGALTTRAIYLSSAVRCRFTNLQIKTTAGGGNDYSGIYAAGACSDILVDHCWFSESDSLGIDANADVVRMKVTNCLIEGCDGYGIGPSGEVAGTDGTIILGNTIQDNGGGLGMSNSQNDDTVVVANVIRDNGYYGITLETNDDNCVIVGNRVTGNSSGQISDNSGSSTVTGNDES